MRAGTDHTVFVALLAAATALAGAAIAAITAGRRQRSQLQHDRDLKDLAELREVLDEATVALKEAINTCQDVFALLDAWAEALADALADAQRPAPWGVEPLEVEQHPDELVQEDFGEEMQRLRVARDRMIVAGQRIAIRRGDDQRIYTTYQRAVTAVIDAIRQAHAEQRRLRWSHAEASTFDPMTLNSRLGEIERTFVRDALALVGSHLPDPEPKS